jgi:hypothetical protein
MTEKFSFRAGSVGGRYRHLTGPAGIGLLPNPSDLSQLLVLKIRCDISKKVLNSVAL